MAAQALGRARVGRVGAALAVSGPQTAVYHHRVVTAGAVWGVPDGGLVSVPLGGLAQIARRRLVILLALPPRPALLLAQSHVVFVHLLQQGSLDAVLNVII